MGVLIILHKSPSPRSAATHFTICEIRGVSCARRPAARSQLTDSQELTTPLEGGLMRAINLITSRNPCTKKPPPYLEGAYL